MAKTKSPRRASTTKRPAGVDKAKARAQSKKGTAAADKKRLKAPPKFKTKGTQAKSKKRLELEAPKVGRRTGRAEARATRNLGPRTLALLERAFQEEFANARNPEKLEARSQEKKDFEKRSIKRRDALNKPGPAPNSSKGSKGPKGADMEFARRNSLTGPQSTRLTTAKARAIVAAKDKKRKAGAASRALADIDAKNAAQAEKDKKDLVKQGSKVIIKLSRKKKSKK